MRIMPLPLVGHGDPDLDLNRLRSWTSLRHLPPQDPPNFVADVRMALFTACREVDPSPLLREIDAWCETAISLSDPTRREILLYEVSGGDDEFVEADRALPTAA